MNGKLILAAFLAASLAGFLWPVARRLRHVRSASGRLPLRPLGRRLLRFAREVLLQEKVIRERPFAGTMHALVFWGFLAFALVTLEHFAAGFGASFLGSGALARGVQAAGNVFALLVLAGILALTWRRFVLRPATLGPFSPGSAAVAALIVLLMATHLAAPLFGEGSPAASANWWIHTGGILAFLFVIPPSKHLHLVLSPFTTFFRDFELARVKPLDFDREEFGAETLPQLPKHTALGAFTCVECGRCSDHCPATGTGKLLDPKQLMLDLRAGWLSDPKGKIAGQTVPESVFWQCTTCGACAYQCPVGIDQVVPILETRRGLVAGARFPAPMRSLFDNLERSSNPWGYPAEQAEKFLSEMNFPEPAAGGLLFWLGCMGRYDAGYRKTVGAFAQLLRSAGVPWGVLRDEKCTGDAARRAGNEFIFAQLARENIDLLNKAAPRSIATTCPHCLRALKEYREMGLDSSIEIVHHTELLARWASEGKLPLRENAGASDPVYHDPCYLSRYEEIVDEPRDVLKNAGASVREPERTRQRSFCCGAGGAMLFAEETEGRRINRERTEELLRTGAKTIAVACPFCALMIRDALADKERSDDVQVRDVAEFAAEGLPPARA